MQCASYQFIAFDTNPSFLTCFGILWTFLHCQLSLLIILRALGWPYQRRGLLALLLECFVFHLHCGCKRHERGLTEALYSEFVQRVSLFPCRLSCGGYWPGSWPPPVQFSSVQLLSRVQLFATMDSSTSGFPVHHQLPELAQIHVHQVGDAIQPPYALSSPSPPTSHLYQCQGLFQWVSCKGSQSPACPMATLSPTGSEPQPCVVGTLC